jgi:catechol 2,3-dioxygenase
MPAVDHLGHVHLKVRDLDRAVAFYRDLLGLEVAERHANFAFLSLGDHHHDLALQTVDAASAEAVTAETDPGEVGNVDGRPTVGLYHSAWEVETEDLLRETYEYLRERDVEVTPVDHGISKALYFDDPDGNGVEVYLDTRAENDRRKWQGKNDRLDPAGLGEDAGGAPDCGR